MTEISASVLNVNEEDAVHVFYNLETAKINYFHIDVMDGKFVENNNLELMKDYALTISHISNIGLDVHLMVENIEEIADDYLMLEPQSLTFHIEASKEEKRTKDLIKDIIDNGTMAGIAINPNTNLDEIKPYLNLIHKVIVMTVVPGKGGQKLIPETLEKVKELKKYIDENNIDIDIEVDGGINDVTSKEAVEAGANILVVGSYLLKSKDMQETVRNLK